MKVTFRDAKILTDDTGVWLCLRPEEAAPCRGFVLEKKDARYDAEIKAHNATLDGIKTQLKTLRGKTVETDTVKDSINLMLCDSGMRGFSLEPKAGVDSVYEVRRPDGTIADNLSEGEKNFIAFLYFYHLVHGSDSADGETREKIVVIDDPVSSMDSSSLFIVSTLVRQMIEICRNNADNRNRTAEGNFIKQFFVLTHNAYFHREVSYSYVAKYDYTSFYLIRKIGTKSTIRLCDDVNPNAPTERINVNPVKNSYAALWDEYKEIISRHDDRGSAAVGNIERFAFYDEAKTAYAIVATGEMAVYANVMLQKGVVTE